MSDLLRRISLDATSPGVALKIIREALDSSIDDAPAIHAQLGEKTWQLLRKPNYDMDEMASWYDVVAHISTLVRHRGDPSTGERLLDLAHLISRDSRFRQLQPLEEVVRRRSTRGLLLELAARGGSCSLPELGVAVGQAEAMMAKLLIILGINGLIERKGYGEEAVVHITELGRSHLPSEGQIQDVA